MFKERRLYPTGWAWAFDTPFKYWKRWSGYEGGAATPFMICGPGIGKKTKDLKHEYEYRKQYIHAVDLVPTLYECLNLEPPEVVKGYTQNPIEGISFKYTFAPQYGQPQYQFPYKLADNLKPKDEKGKPKKVRETQFYSMLGTADRIEQADLEFHRRVQQGFVQLADLYPQRIVRIDASKSEEEVHLAIQEILDQRLRAWFQTFSPHL